MNWKFKPMRTNKSKVGLSLALIFILTACAAKFVKYEKAEELKTNTEFENTVKIVKPDETVSEAGPEGAVTGAPTSQTIEEPVIDTGKHKKKAAKKFRSTTPAPEASSKTKKSVKAKDKKKESSADEGEAPAVQAREPALEDSEGFNGRRPIVDPFRVGEEVIHAVRYFKVQAGTLKLKVEPFAYVNNRKAYSFVTEITSSSVFSTFYSVEDRIEAMADFETLSAMTYALHVKESGQLREGRSYFDEEKKIANYWEKKYTEKKGHEEKKIEWELLPYSQNVFTAIFYMRNFQWRVGKEISFRVSHDNESLLFKGTAIRKEVLDTDAGKFNAIVIKPEISVKGAFKPMGDIFIWLSDDDRKYVLRIESNIKIGTLISEVIEIKSGK